MGHSQQGFMVSMTHGTLFRLSVTTHGYSYHLTNFKPSAAAGWQFQSHYGWNLVPHSSSKRSISIALTLSPEPLVQLLLIQAIFLTGICNIHSRKEERAANSTSHESRDNWHISAKAHSPFNQMMRPSGQVYYIWDDVQDTRVVYILYQSNQRFLARSRPFTMDKPC